MVKTINNFFVEKELQQITVYQKDEYAKEVFIDMPTNRNYINKVIEKASEFYETEDIIITEQWSHNPHWKPLPTAHYDKDEKLFKATGELSFPVFSAIIYLKVQNLIGSKLLLEYGNCISPETGLLVLLPPGMLHAVSPWESGVRLTVNLNFWTAPLYSS